MADILIRLVADFLVFIVGMIYPRPELKPEPAGQPAMIAHTGSQIPPLMQQEGDKVSHSPLWRPAQNPSEKQAKPA
ncbi:MAG TPA: hypothetical protein PLU38_03435 [Kiritimatiellia bacterium]|nr:hypothetical protein [Kiritimatiellia bacterium]